MTDRIINLTTMLSGKSKQEQQAIIANSLEQFIREILNAAENFKMTHTTSFHDLGMDSITAVNLKSMIQESLGDGIEINSEDIFNYPTIELLAEYIESSLGLTNIKIETNTDQDKPEKPVEVIGIDDLVKRLQTKLTKD